jgi:putative transposase
MPSRSASQRSRLTAGVCVIHLIRGTVRYASKRYWEALARDLRPIYTAPTAEAAWTAFETFEETWGSIYPAIGKLSRSSWEEFIPFLAYDVEIRRVLCSTDAVESLNARYRRAVTAKGHFPTEQAALKTLYLVTRSLDPKGTGQARWITRWKPALNAFAITFADRMPAAENL